MLGLSIFSVRKFHEVADVATKADIIELKNEIAEVNRNIADIRKDLYVEIADVRKDMEHRFEKVEIQINDARKEAVVHADKTDAKIALLHKDIVKSYQTSKSLKWLVKWLRLSGFETAIIKLV